MALATLSNHRLLFHGREGRPLAVDELAPDGEPLFLLFPSEDALSLSEAKKRFLPRAPALVVPDGNWGQGRRLSRRLLQRPGIVPVTLPEGAQTEWRVRNEPRENGLSTYEAIARAFGVLESADVQEQMEVYFRKMVKKTFELRGTATETLVEDP